MSETGVQGRILPSWSIFFHLYAVWEIFGQIIGRSPSPYAGLVLLRLGNPGSATVACSNYETSVKAYEINTLLNCSAHHLRFHYSNSETPLLFLFNKTILCTSLSMRGNAVRL